MRILELYLPAFGPFEDVGLVLSGGDRGVHVVYGPNEAGKSSTLRALRALLYGVPQQTPDSFRHDYSRLRVGAKLRDEEGRELALLRRKGKKDTVLDLDGRPMADAHLERLLGGVPEDIFASIFALDHEALVRGGAEILEGGGRLGESLFAAALGGAGLRQVLGSLASEMDALFRPLGKKQEVNRALADLAGAKRTLKEKSLSYRDWKQHREALDRAREEAARVDDEIARIRREVTRLERLHRALPLGRRLESLGRKGVPRQERGPQRTQRSERVAALPGEAAAGGPPTSTALLDQGDVIQDFRERLGAYNKARRDLGPLRHEMAELRAEAQGILADLRPGLDVADADSLRLDEERESAVRELAELYGTLLGEENSRREEVARLECDLGLLESRRQSLSEPPDATPLIEVMRHVPQDLEDELVSARAELEAREEEARAGLEKLPFFRGGIEELEALRVPTGETVDRYEEELTELGGRRKEHEKALRDSETEIAELELQLDVMKREGTVPSEEDLAGLRARRDAGWKRVREAWGGESTDATLLDDYEESAVRADELADRLRREAGRVARGAELSARLDRSREKSTRSRSELERLELRRAERFAAWTAEWAELAGSGTDAGGVGGTAEPLSSGAALSGATASAAAGQDVPSPREMRAWLRAHDGLVESARALRGLRSRVGQLVERVRRHREELRRELGPLERVGESRDGETGGLGTILARGRVRVEALEKERKSFDKLETERRALGDQLVRERKKLDALEVRSADVRREWCSCMEAFSLPGDATPSRVHGVLGKLRRLFSRVDAVSQRRSRIEQMESDGAQFRQDIAGFVKRVSPGLDGVPPEEAVGELHSRWSVAKEAAAERGQLEDRLREEAAGQPLEEFLRLLEDVDEEALEADLVQLRRERSELEEELKRWNQQIGRETTELERMRGEAEAADARGDVESSLARIRDGAERYARLKLAALLLEREVERYRRENQEPVVRRASELFRHLTGESFEELRTALDERDRPLLEGVRPGGERVRVEGMSDGTRDQLFLALRLASLERHIEAHPPMPLVVDDLLINFDDERALATLEVLAELSRRTQVIFFTHHRHLVDLARRVVPRGVLQVPSYVPLADLLDSGESSQ
ncbi:MAG: AAA family ATPase [Planctomycetota bacterium]|nr:AAA family ATPase [Planctomycetota bacterium]